jgi:Icc protein
LRLGHISDLHLSDRGRYPRNGYAPRDCDRHSNRLAQRVLDEMEKARVDHLVVTGDLTLSSESAEFERAAKLLRKWADAGKLTIVPGNHDVWTAESVKTSRFLRMVGPDGRGMRKPVPSYPFAALPAPEVAIIALDSTRYGDEPFDTSGLIGSAQLQACRELVRDHVKEGRAVLLALHHHLMLPRERVPSDALVARTPLLHDIPGAAGPTPVLCAGSASRVTDEPVRRARGYVYEVDRGGIRSTQVVLANAG